MIKNSGKALAVLFALLLAISAVACNGNTPSGEITDPEAHEEVSAYTQEEIDAMQSEIDRLADENKALKDQQASAEEPDDEETPEESLADAAMIADAGNLETVTTSSAPVATNNNTSSSGAAGSSAASGSSNANGTGIFSGYNVTVNDKTTPAVSSGGKDYPFTTYYFFAANGATLGSISGTTYYALEKKYMNVPADGDLSGWFAEQFNKFRGITNNNSGGSAGFSGSSSNEIDTNAAANEIIRLVNNKRAEVGLHELEVDSSLMDHAAIRAEELSISYSHVRPNGTKETSECIVMRRKSAAEAFQAWMDSDSHRTAILNENGRYNYNYIGAGCYRDEKGVLYWVITFSV